MAAKKIRKSVKIINQNLAPDASTETTLGDILAALAGAATVEVDVQSWGGVAVAAADVNGRPEVSVFSALLATAANQLTEITALGTLHTDLNTTIHGDMVTLNAKDFATQTTLEAFYAAASTSALQTSGNASLTSIASKDFATQTTLATLATAAAQTTGNTSLASIVTNTAPLAYTQGSATSGEVGPLMQAAVLTNSPAYTNAQTSPLNMTVNGLLRTGLFLSSNVAVTGKALDGAIIANTVTGAVNTASALYAWDIANNARSLAVYGAAQSRAFTATDNALETRTNLNAVAGAAVSFTDGSTTGKLPVSLFDALGGRLVFMTDNAYAAASYYQLPVIPAVAKAAAPTRIEGDQVLLRTDLKGSLANTSYDQAGLALDSLHGPAITTSQYGVRTNSALYAYYATSANLQMLRINLGSEAYSAAHPALAADANIKAIGASAVSHTTGATTGKLPTTMFDGVGNAITSLAIGSSNLNSSGDRGIVTASKLFVTSVGVDYGVALTGQPGSTAYAASALELNVSDDIKAIGGAAVSHTTAATSGKLPTTMFDGVGNAISSAAISGGGYLEGKTGLTTTSKIYAYHPGDAWARELTGSLATDSYLTTHLELNSAANIKAVAGVAVTALAATSNTTGTGFLPSSMAAVFDDTSPTAITENNFGAVRMSSRRELYNQIRDAAGNERGLNIDANNRAGVVLANASRSDTYTGTANGTAIDCSTFPFKQFALQVVQTGTVTAWDIRIEGSIDGTNYDQTNYLAQHTNVTGSGAIVWSVDKAVKYVRTRCAGFTLGLGTNVIAYIVAVQ